MLGRVQKKGLRGYILHRFTRVPQSTGLEHDMTTKWYDANPMDRSREAYAFLAFKTPHSRRIPFANPKIAKSVFYNIASKISMPSLCILYSVLLVDDHDRKSIKHDLILLVMCHEPALQNPP